MFTSADMDSTSDITNEKKKQRKLCSSCTIKDHSPLGLLGIFLITAGVIIAIFDAKDAIPNKTASYAMLIGMVLIVVGVASVVIAFMGYRRTRALSREILSGTKCRRSGGNDRRASRRVSFSSSPRKNSVYRDYDFKDISQKPEGSCLVCPPEDYGVYLPKKDFYFHGFEGEDNLAFQKSPAHELSFTVLSSPSNNSIQKTSRLSPKRHTSNLSPKHQDNGSLQCILVGSQRLSSDEPYIPNVLSWPNLDLPNYIPPVSTTV